MLGGLKGKIWLRGRLQLEVGNKKLANGGRLINCIEEVLLESLFRFYRWFTHIVSVTNIS